MVFNLGFGSIHAPSFPDDLTWLNSDPLGSKELQGKVVLVDFWTYSCINCQRTLPYLKTWWKKYQGMGLVIVGVHTPEFEFEKEFKNVKQALEKYEVDWPVVLDNDYLVWNSFANHYWLAKYLVSHEGKIIYTHFGEGNYQETELEIQKALTDAGFKVSDSTVGKLLEEGVQQGQTPELYFGSKRGIIEKLEPGFDSTKLEANQIYQVGDWSQSGEYLEHSKQTQELTDLIVLKYRAKKVYLVMESVNPNKPIKAYVTLDGVGIKNNGAGRDVEFEEEDRGYVEVSFSTLYNLIETDKFGEHVLRISTLDKGLRLFAFTFGS